MVEQQEFAEEIALKLKAGANVSLFGPRDIGKTSFLSTLARELAKDHGLNAPPYTALVINLKRGLSIQGIISCIREALEEHPSSELRKIGRQSMDTVESELGFNVRLLSYTQKRSPKVSDDEEVLNLLLKSLRKHNDRLVIVFDEFQRLIKCNGDPLGTIQSALMHTNSDVSLLFTGSIRAALQLMLEDDNKPMFNQTEHMNLPVISFGQFFAFLAGRFTSSGKPATEEAMNHLLNITTCHPKRTQQLAGKVWDMVDGSQNIEADDVQRAYDLLLKKEDGAFHDRLEMFATGKPGDEHALRVLVLLADQYGETTLTSDLLRQYGITKRPEAVRAYKELEMRGILSGEAGSRKITDPLFAEWLRRSRSPNSLGVLSSQETPFALEEGSDTNN